MHSPKKKMNNKMIFLLTILKVSLLSYLLSQIFSVLLLDILHWIIFIDIIACITELHCPKNFEMSCFVFDDFAVKEKEEKEN